MGFNDISNAAYTAYNVHRSSFFAAYAASKGRSLPCSLPFYVGSVGGTAPDSPGDSFLHYIHNRGVYRAIIA